MQVNILNSIYLNCGEWYEDMIHQRSFQAHNLSSREINGLIIFSDFNLRTD